MNGFVRYTHDKNGRYRKLPEWKNDDIDATYLHCLREHPMTLEDIINDVRKYNRQFPDASYDTDIGAICRSLVSMLEYDMIKIVELDDNTWDKISGEVLREGDELWRRMA